jgi:hypothetical protein
MSISLSYTDVVAKRSLSLTTVEMNPMSIGNLLSRPCASSSSTSGSSYTLPEGPELTILQNCIRQLFLTTDRTAQSVERLIGDVHLNYLLHMSDGTDCIMKSGPGISRRTMRQEQNRLESESRILLKLAQNTNLPVPRRIKYASQSCSQVVRPPYLLRSFIPGRPLAELLPTMQYATKAHIEQTVGIYFLALSTLTANAFGPPHAVHSGNGWQTWREAFLAMLEAALRDAEDMLVSIPYDSIRYHIMSRAEVLDAITTPRLAALKACLPDKVLVDEATSQVVGLLGFGDVVWGDPEMAAVFADPSDAFLLGCGMPGLAEDTGDGKTRRLM